MTSSATSNQRLSTLMSWLRNSARWRRDKEGSDSVAAIYLEDIAAELETMRSMLSGLADAVLDTMRAHPDALECCSITKSRAEAAQQYLSANGAAVETSCNHPASHGVMAWKCDLCSELVESAAETETCLPACDCDPDFGCKERDPTKFICQARKLERLARASDVASEAREPPYRIRSFWSPDKRHLVTACCSADDITVLDDNANIWEPTGPEADITAPSFAQETTPELAPGTKVTMLYSVLGTPVDGWEINGTDAPRERRYQLKHPNGSLIDVARESFVVNGTGD